MNRIAAKLKRVEERAGIGARCAHCRLFLRSTWPRFGGGATASDSKDEKLLISCHFCETQYNVTIPASWPEWKREVTRLSRTYKEDDFYTDKKAAAVRLYCYCFVRRTAARRASGEKLAEAMARFAPEWKPKFPVHTPARREQPKPLTKNAKLRQSLIDEYLRDVRGEQRAMRKKYGRRFPELEALVGALTRSHFFYFDHQKPNIEGDDYLKHLRAWASLEAMIWGEPLPHTLEEIAEHERALARLVAAIDERDRKRQEERDERERERLARIEAARCPTPLVIPQPAEHWLTGQDSAATNPAPVGTAVPEPSAEWLEHLRRRRASLAPPETLKGLRKAGYYK